MEEKTIKSKKIAAVIGAAALSLVVSLGVTLGATAKKVNAEETNLTNVPPEELAANSQIFAVSEESANGFVDVKSDENGVSYIVPNSFRFSSYYNQNVSKFDFAKGGGCNIFSTKFTLVTKETDENGVITYAPRNADIDDIEFFNCGYNFNVGSEPCSLFLRTFNGSSSIDVGRDSGRWRLMNDSVNALVSEFLRTNELKVELAQKRTASPYSVHLYSYNYFFKFTSGEACVSFGNMPYATVYNMTGGEEWFLCAESGSISGETKTSTRELFDDLAQRQFYGVDNADYFKIYSTISRQNKADYNVVAENDKYFMKVETDKNFTEFKKAYAELYAVEHHAEEPDDSTEQNAVKAWFEKLGSGINNLFGFNVANKYSAAIGVAAVALVALLIFRRKRR